MRIRKSIVASFLPCLDAFMGFNPSSFLKCFFVACFGFESKSMVAALQLVAI